ncbi:MAG: class I SAM-dependent methyltransferase [Terriglobales bacterium]
MQSLRDRPGDRALVGDSEDDGRPAFQVLEHGAPWEVRSKKSECRSITAPSYERRATNTSHEHKPRTQATNFHLLAARRGTSQDLWIGVLRSGGKIRCRRGTKLSERSGTLADDPFSGRHPTSHEQLSGLPWDASYHDGPAPWDTGQPQPAIVRLASEGGFAGAVLDAGCGTGENALHVASLGLSVLGVDVAETALAIAREKADDRGIEAEFAVADAFQLERLGRRFETVLDCGLFHTFDGAERPGYVASLASVTEHDGTLYVLCFSDDGPDTGPHPISQEDLRAAFNPSNGWNVAAIEPDRIQTRYHDDGAPAWFATIKRI